MPRRMSEEATGLHDHFFRQGFEDSEEDSMRPRRPLFQRGVLQIMQVMGVHTGHDAHAYVNKEDEARVTIAEQRAQATTREARMRRRQDQLNVLEAASAADGLLYGPGIDDFI